MEFDYTERYIFWAEWFHVEASMARPFYLYYFPVDGSVELFDHKTKKTFLRRTKIEGILASDFYVGAKLNIFGRQVEILDYGDTITKTKIGSKRETTFAIIKPEVVNRFGDILIIFMNNGFKLNQCRMMKLTPHEAILFYSTKSGDALLPFLMENLTSGPIIGLELVGDHAVQKLIKLCGPENSDDARKSDPSSLRAEFGIDHIKNAIHCSESVEDSKREREYFFPKDQSGKKFQTTEQFGNCTLGIIKPHVIKDGAFGEIIQMIVNSGFNLTAMKMIYMDRVNCEEFYEVYKGVAPEYVQMVLQLANGPCLAMEISAKQSDVDTHLAFRTLCGPIDPELARQIRPNTIRAKFGKNKVLNAIHCTDLPEDTHLEVEYLFKILS